MNPGFSTSINPPFKRPIGVFDSGVGGLSVLQALRAELPFENFVYVSDNGFAPYGERDDAFVIDRARRIARHSLEDRHPAVKTLVIACNTATAAAIHLLRQDYPALPFVGVEPALKPAAACSRTGRVGVMATRGTLASQKFTSLLASLGSRTEFICQPCDGLADAIEHENTTQIEALCALYIRDIGQFGINSGEIDTLVLGCTHYPFARAQLQALLPAGVQIIDNGEPVARQTRRVLPDAAIADTPGEVTLLCTGNPATLARAAQHWLGLTGAVQLLNVGH